MATGDHMVKVFVSTIPGLEFIAASECNELFGVKSTKEGRGRVSFSIPVKLLPKLSELRSVHHFWMQVYQTSSVLQAENSKEETLETLEELVNTFDWNLAMYGLNFFKEKELSNKINKKAKDGSVDVGDNIRDNTTEEGQSRPNCFATDENVLHNDNLKRKAEEDLAFEEKVCKTVQGLACLHANNKGSDEKKCTDCHNVLESHVKIEENNQELTYLNRKPTDIKFRVTCHRNGKHTFSSMEAAKYIGSGVKGYFGWNVDLENFDIEILAFIEDFQITIAVKLSEESKHNRNVKFFGPTTLRATTSYCMLKLAGVKRGDIVCDPMCGTGSIGLEGVESFPFSFHLGGEIHQEGCQNAKNNFEHLEGLRKSGLPNDVMSWDACRLPLRDGLLDVLVCDLPFGKRIGYKGRNFMLYPAVLKEMGRVCKYKGKAVLLTQHKSAMNKALNSLNRVWQKQGTFFMNMGGLNAGIYVLKKIAR